MLDELQYYKKDLGDFEIGGTSHYIDQDILPIKSKTIEIDFAKMENFIFGQPQDNFQAQATTILQNLGFKVHENQVTPPIRRSPDDMNIAEDIAEEVARIYGYDCIQSLPLTFDVTPTPYTPFVQITRTLEDILVRNIGANQTETYPRIGEKTLEMFQTNKETCFCLQNPVNPETPYLRDQMTYGLLSHIIKNHKFFDTCKIFDFGKVWNKTNPSKDAKQKFASQFVQEDYEIGIMLYQKESKSRESDLVLEGKSLVHTMCQQLGYTGKIHYTATANTAYHPKKQAQIFCDDILIWTIGTLHPIVMKNNKLPETAAVVSINLRLAALLQVIETKGTNVPQYETLQDQIIYRDLCFVVDSHETFEPILHAIQAIPEIEEVEIFDVYAGKNLGEGKKSLSFKMKMKGEWNMTTEEINAIMDKAIKAGEKAGGVLRG